MLLLQYSRSTLFFSSGGCIFVITFTFLGSWRTLLLDVMCSAVYVSYFRTLEHTFVLFQVTFICKQTSSENFILHLLFSTTGKTEMRNIVKSSGFSGTIRERSWSRNVFFKNSKVLTEFKCYFWLKFWSNGFCQYPHCWQHFVTSDLCWNFLYWGNCKNSLLFVLSRSPESRHVHNLLTSLQTQSSKPSRFMKPWWCSWVPFLLERRQIHLKVPLGMLALGIRLVLL